MNALKSKKTKEEKVISVQKTDKDQDIIKNIKGIMTGNIKENDDDTIELTDVIHDIQDHNYVNQQDSEKQHQSENKRKQLISDIQKSLENIKTPNKKNINTSKETFIDNGHKETTHPLKDIIKKEIGEIYENQLNNQMPPNLEDDKNPRIKDFVENCIKKSADNWINNNIQALVTNWVSNNLEYLLQNVLQKWLEDNGNEAIKNLLRKEIEDAIKEAYITKKD